MDEAIVVVTNLPDLDTAQALARRLVGERLAACANIVPGVQSIYRWQGQVEEAGEVTVLIKTMRSRYEAVEEAIQRLHPYELPEVIAIPVAAALPAYLAWLQDETRKDLDV
jgi:periplasmic divalent cation tolerance protein